MEDVSKELVSILLKVLMFIENESDMTWTGYDSVNELRNEINTRIDEIKMSNFENIDSLNSHFLPTTTFQEHSISNGWGKEYLKLAKEFDLVYLKVKNRNTK